MPETKGSGSLGYFWVQALGDSLVIAPEVCQQIWGGLMSASPTWEQEQQEE